MPPRDGNGNYGLPAGNPVVTATTISSTVQNNTENDMAAAITASLAADGQTSPSADLKMSGFKHKNVANASSRISTNSSYASAADVQDGTITHLTGVAGTNTVTASAPLGLAAYVTGQIFTFLPAVTNTGATTLNVNSIGAKSVFSNGQACGGNELIASQPVEVKYDGTQFNILAGPPVFVDTYFRIKGSADATKQVRFEADGITTATTRVVTLPDADITLANWSTGDVKLTFKTVADSTWVLMDDGTIGNAASGGTTRANADTSALFTLLWTNTVNADCAVSTGRGGSAAADYAANKTIALPKALGRALAGYGTGSGLTARALAHVVGEENHQLSIAELASHTHVEQGRGNVGGATTPQGTSGGGGIVTFDPVSAATGSDTPHNTMQPTVFLNVMIKL